MSTVHGERSSISKKDTLKSTPTSTKQFLKQVECFICFSISQEHSNDILAAAATFNVIKNSTLNGPIPDKVKKLS